MANLSLRYLSELKPGQCHARNLGLKEGRGEVFLFTDDDVRVPIDWISRMCEPILRGECDASVGGIVPGPGRSVEKVFLPPAVFDPFATDMNPILIGANMAFHRKVLAVVGRFDTNLGPGAMGMGDDTLFSLSIERAGFRISALKDAQVEHWFDVERCGEEDQRKTARQLARAKAYMDFHFHRRNSSSTWISVLKSRFWLSRLQLKRNCFGNGRYPLTGWELHQIAEVAYRSEYLKQQVRSRTEGVGSARISALSRSENATSQAL
jgi:glycosyltransferase involved in cell wall biosynthesis